MRRVVPNGIKAATALLGCLIVAGCSALDASDIAKNGQSASVVANPIRKGDRLPVIAAAKADAQGPSSRAMRAADKRPPLGCDPLFSPIAEPAQARLYKRCAA